MRFDPIYALQRKTIERKMHAQVNKLYLHERSHPYVKDMHDLQSQYIHRMQTLASMIDEAVRKKKVHKELLRRALFEVSSNPCAQIKLSYHDLIDIRSVCLDYAHAKRTPEEYIKTIQTCTRGLLPRIPEIIPCSDTVVHQIADLNSVVEWQMSVSNFSVQDILQHTKETYLNGIAHTCFQYVHPKSPPTSDYLLNLNAVVYSSLRHIFRAKYAKEDTSIIYWCCMYLRYCAPGFLSTRFNQDAYTRTRHVLKILHNEWKYLLYKYQ